MRRPLFASGDRRREQQRPRDPSGRRRAHHRRKTLDAQADCPIRSPSRIACPTLRRIDEIFDNQRARGPGLLGRPQCVRRRRRLRLQADIFYAPPWYIISQSLPHFSSNDIGAASPRAFSACFVGHDQRPPLSTRWQRCGATRGFVGYAGPDADVTASSSPLQPEFFGFRRAFERKKATPPTRWARINTGLSAAVPAIPTRRTASWTQRAEIRLNASVVGFDTFLGSSLDMVQVKAAPPPILIDATSRYVLAGRVAAGRSATRGSTPFRPTGAFMRGDGSVRGYACGEFGPTVSQGAIVQRRTCRRSASTRRSDRHDQHRSVLRHRKHVTSNCRSSTARSTAAATWISIYAFIGPIRLDVAFPLQQHTGTRADHRLCQHRAVLLMAQLSPPGDVSRSSPSSSLRQRALDGRGRGCGRQPDLAAIFLAGDDVSVGARTASSPHPSISDIVISDTRPMARSRQGSAGVEVRLALLGDVRSRSSFTSAAWSYCATAPSDTPPPPARRAAADPAGTAGSRC